MKVMKVLDKKVEGVTYYKYRINLPKDLVDELQLLNKELSVRKEGKRIIIEKQ